MKSKFKRFYIYAGTCFILFVLMCGMLIRYEFINSENNQTVALETAKNEYGTLKLFIGIDLNEAKKLCSSNSAWLNTEQVRFGTSDARCGTYLVESYYVKNAQFDKWRDLILRFHDGQVFELYGSVNSILPDKPDWEIEKQNIGLFYYSFRAEDVLSRATFGEYMIEIKGSGNKLNAIRIINKLIEKKHIDFVKYCT